jgi:hypothetical protein
LELGKTPKIKTYDWVDKRTGEIKQVPVGIDPGWDINPGKVGLASAGLL